MGWVFKNVVLSFVSNIINGLLDIFGDMITSIYEFIADANLSNSMVVNANSFTTMFAIALVIFMAAKSYFSIFVLETEGDQDSNALDILTRAAQATAVISCNVWISNTFLEFSKSFASDLVTNADVEIVTNVTSLLSTAVGMSTLGGGIFVLMLLVMVIALMVFVVQAGIRGAELGLSKILFPIFAVDLVGNNRERWNSFFPNYVITYLGYSIQLLCFRAFDLSLASMAVGAIGPDGIRALGWLVLMIKAPKWLERFCYSSGISRTMGSGLRTAMFVAPRMMH